MSQLSPQSRKKTAEQIEARLRVCPCGRAPGRVFSECGHVYLGCTIPTCVVAYAEVSGPPLAIEIGRRIASAA